MVSITREAREERIEQDDGDLDDNVVVSTSPGHVTYHVDDDCLNLPSSTRTVTRREAQEMRRCPCRRCVLGYEGPSGQSEDLPSCKGTNNDGDPCGNTASILGYCSKHIHQRGDDS